MHENKNFTSVDIGPLDKLIDLDYMGFKGKFFLGKELGLTGCEVSLNRLPAGSSMPFVHSHEKNEEVYIILQGKGTFFVDGSEFPVEEGGLIRISPAAERSWKADDEDLYFICIQAEAGSLTQATRDDGTRLPTKASWMDE